MPFLQAADPSDLTNHLKPLASLPKGDLYVKFSISFPTDLNDADKSKIVELLKLNAEQTNS